MQSGGHRQNAVLFLKLLTSFAQLNSFAQLQWPFPSSVTAAIDFLSLTRSNWLIDEPFFSRSRRASKQTFQRVSCVLILKEDEI